MWGTSEQSSSMSVWGAVIFFILLFFIFDRNRNQLDNGSTALLDTARTSAQLDFENYKANRDIQCDLEKQSAVTDGKLELGFRAVIDNDNKNTVEILRGQDQAYIKQLERENAQLYADKSAGETRNLILASEARIERRLDSISCNMLEKPPVYPTTCVPCSTNACNGFV